MSNPGEGFEQQVFNLASSKYPEAARRVSVSPLDEAGKIQHSKRVVVDVLTRDGNGKFRMWEAKDSATEPLRINQADRFKEIRKHGGVVKGRPKVNPFPGGMEIPAGTRHTVVRPEDLSKKCTGK